MRTNEYLDDVPMMELCICFKRKIPDRLNVSRVIMMVLLFG